MIKVASFNETIGSKRFKEFLAQPFLVDMLYPIKNDLSIETLFEGWRGKNMINWFKFTNDNKFILEFYPTYYQIKKDTPNSITYMMSIPISINDFIEDMKRFGIELFWTEWIDNNFEPNEYLPENEIKNYYTKFLDKMGKSHELL